MVSVVMIAAQASVLPSGFSFPARRGIPFAMGAMGSGWPMTPVEATTTSCGEMERASATRLLMVSAISIPSALQVFALPLLQMTAWAFPSARCALVTVSGAPFTRFVVYTAAALAGTLLVIRARSFFSGFFRMPQ